MHKLTSLAPLALLLLAGCPTDEPGGDGFVGGNFTFVTTAVDDACNDGALNVIFLPEGDGSENEFGDAIYMPGDDELPFEGTVPLQDPFQDLDVTINGTAGETRTFTGAVNDDIDLDPDTYPVCTVDLEISVDCTLPDNDSANCTATLSMSDVVGDDCPVMTADPCDITLTISGTRN